MGLSTHELWLVLRARDEATRIVRNLTNGLVQAQTEGTSTQIRNLKQLMATEAIQFRQFKDYNNNVIDGYAIRNGRHNVEISSIKNKMAAAKVAYDAEILQIKSLTENDKAGRTAQMAAAKANYDALRIQNQQAIIDAKALIDKNNERILSARELGNAHKAMSNESRALHEANLARAQATLEKEREAVAARQQTISSIRQVGTAAVTAGISVAALGAGILYAMNIGVQAHRDYQQAASKAYTQVDDKVNISLENVRNMGKVVAGDIPAAFEQMQPALYDIFSSIEVRGKEAASIGEEILRQAAKAAVAGQVDVQTAVQTSVGLLNGYGMKIETVAQATEAMNKVNDFMFTLVKEGVGDYEDFGAAVGKIIPSAQRAGVEMNDFGAVLALLTRNGASAANAGTFVARALDAISKTKTQENFQKLGLSVRDASGQFKPLSQIMDEVSKKMATMSEPQKASFIEELFKGSGGTIQAMKALIPALTNANGLYTELQASMAASGGAAEAAYNIMKATPEAQIQEMKNQWSILSETVGKAAMPAFLAITKVIGDLAAWFNNLSPSTQTMIVNLGIAAGVFSVIMGIILVLGGGLMILVSALMAVGVAATAGAAVGMIAAFAGIAAAIAVVVGLVVAFWPQITAGAQAAFDIVSGAISTFVSGFMQSLAPFTSTFEGIWEYISGFGARIGETFSGIIGFGLALIASAQGWMGDLGLGFGTIQEHLALLGPAFNIFGQAVGNVISWLGVVFGVLISILITVGEFFTSVFGGAVLGAIMGAWVGIQGIVAGIISIFVGLITVIGALFTGNWSALWEGVLTILTGILELIYGAIMAFVGVIVGLIAGLVNGIIGYFTNLYDVLVGNSIIPDMVNAIIEWIASLPGAIFATLAGLVSGAIAKFNELKSGAASKINEMVSTVVAYIVAFVFSVITNIGTIPSKASAALSSLGTAISNIAKTAWTMFLTTVTTGATNTINFVRTVPQNIVSALGAVSSLLSNAGRAIMDGFLAGLKASWAKVTDFVKGTAAWIKANKGPLDYDYKLLQPAGNAIMSGFGDALNNGFSTVQSSVATMGARLVTSATSNAMSQAAMFKDVGIISGKNLVSGLLSMESQVAGAAGRMNAAIALDTALNNGSVVSNGARLSGATVNVDVHTQEIDPEKNAADLGHEISSRLGSW